METNGKAAKFRELAEHRVSKTLIRIRQLGHLSRRTSYDYEPDQVEKMFKALRDEIAIVESRFNQHKSEQPSFTF